MIAHHCDKSLPCALCRRGMSKFTVSKNVLVQSRQSLPVVPCSLLGDELTGLERDARNLDHRRPWRWCGHPDKPLGEAVCGCAGCGPGCNGYAKEVMPVPCDRAYL